MGRRENLRSLFRQVMGFSPSLVEMASPPSSLADPVPCEPERPQQTLPVNEHFGRPLIRVSIETGQVLEDHLHERKEGKSVGEIAASATGEGTSRRYNWEALKPRIIALHKLGKSRTGIAKALGMSVASYSLNRIDRILKESAQIANHEEDARIGGLCPVEESLGGEAPDPQRPVKDLEAPMYPGVPWRVLCEGISCDTCVHGHVCGRREMVAAHPWMVCRDWRKEAS